MSQTARPVLPGHAPQDLSGQLWLFPGAPACQPVLRSSRPDLVPTLLRGRPAAQAPDLLAAVFTLCAHAHRWTAQRALAAAAAAAPLAGCSAPALAQARQAHRLATLREHLLRISHDWPRLLPGAPALPDAALRLRTCPVWRTDLQPQDQLAALPAWLVQQWLGECATTAGDPLQAVRQWLAEHDADPGGWSIRWVTRCTTPLARLLRSQLEATQVLAAPGPSLSQTLDPARDLPVLARTLAAEPGFCQRPHWQGGVPDSGPWARQHDPRPQAGANAWQRLVARVVETLRLAVPGGEALLSHGELSLVPGEGVAWTEMARGLLVHWVRLAPSDTHASPDTPVRLADYRVLAPTEWNFHPEGVLARALRGLTAGDSRTPDNATRLALAFDPCVAFELAPAIDNASFSAEGPSHA